MFLNAQSISRPANVSSYHDYTDKLSVLTCKDWLWKPGAYDIIESYVWQAEEKHSWR